MSDRVCRQNRQIRKMVGRFGHRVMALHREAFGPVSVAGLAAGDMVALTPEELLQLGIRD